MSLTYFKILANAAARTGEGGSISGSSSAAVESNFSAFGPGAVDNAVFPFSVQKDALLLAEEKIVQTIASIENHPYRVYLRSVSDPLATRAVLPAQDTGAVDIVGVPGAIYDASDNVLLTRPQVDDQIAEIERINRLTTAGVLFQNYYYYAFDGAMIVHTRPSVKMEVCKYSRSVQAVAIAANQEVLLPEVLEELYVCGEISYLFENSEAPENVKNYLEYFKSGLETIAQGGLI